MFTKGSSCSPQSMRYHLFDKAMKLFPRELPKFTSFVFGRPVRESVAHLPREANQEAEDEREKGQPESCVQRGVGF